MAIEPRVLSVVPEHHLQHVADNMRFEDRREVLRAAGYDPYEALFASVTRSAECGVVLFDDEPVAMFGVVADSTKGVGIPWALGTDSIAKHRVKLYRFAKDTVRRWRSKYSALHNYVDAEHEDSIRFLDALGFEIYEPVIAGFTKSRFSYFCWERSN